MDKLYFPKDILKFSTALIWVAHILLLCCSPLHAKDDPKFGDVSCNYSSITTDIFLEENFEGIIYPEGNFFNPSCSYFAPLISVTQRISFSLPLSDCGTIIRELDGNIYVSNTIIVQRHRFIETALDVVHNITCELPYKNLNFKNWSTENNYNRYANNGFEAWMDFKLGTDILGKNLSNKLLVGDGFLIIIHLKDGEVNKDLKVEDCWAFEEETMQESRYTLHIYDSCAPETTYLVSGFKFTKGMENISDSMVYAVFKAFKFPTTNEVHITCSVQICTHSCLDKCKNSESAVFNATTRRIKRSTTDTYSGKSLRERYKLMKATVKALGAKLIESNRAQRSENNSPFQRRVSHSESTRDNETIVHEMEDSLHEIFAITINNSQFDVPTDLSKDFEAETEPFSNDVYMFNLTNNVVVFKSRQFNFRPKYVADYAAYCETNMKYVVTMTVLCFITFCLFVTCIGLALYLRKEKKRHKINDFLLYNFY